MIAVIGGAVGACATDTVRFSENPFSNPFRTADSGADPVRTGSIDATPAAAPMPRSTIRSEPLAPVRSASPEPRAPVPATARTASTGPGGWSTAGGTPITVGSGDTVSTISSRYGVPANAILSANGVTASQVTPGRRIVIPVYAASGEPAPVRPVRAAEAPGRVVSSSRIDAKRPMPRSVAEAAETRARPRPGGKTARAAEPARIPFGRAEAKAPARAAPPPGKVARAEPKTIRPAAPPKPEPAPAKVAAKADPKPARVVRAEPAPAPKQVAAAPEPVRTPTREPDSTASLTPADTSPGFRWPARGRVISGFGGSGSNEGINIAVPDGTPVKAAGDGVVAYAGSEVKGYGNLVLIRHDNGYVSAYAHNGDIAVKRGQKVTRGDTIARSGQSGNVTSPQLHFEIRKGSTPVDPTRYLASAN